MSKGSVDRSCRPPRPRLLLETANRTSIVTAVRTNRSSKAPMARRRRYAWSPWQERYVLLAFLVWLHSGCKASHIRQYRERMLETWMCHKISGVAEM